MSWQTLFVRRPQILAQFLHLGIDPKVHPLRTPPFSLSDLLSDLLSDSLSENAPSNVVDLMKAAIA